VTKEELKSLFLKLTEYTIPFGKENSLVKLLPSGYKRDSVGNYYYEIGNSETLFTSHLDTFSKKHEKVNHIIENDFTIKTDGKTILGGDNKLGCCILIGMIKNGVPGTYYFFIGEEPILSGGLYGSRKILSENPNFFKKYKRAVAFDRKEYGSIVVRQGGRMCCSLEFATALDSQFKNIEWDPSRGFGYFTDTATFMDIIPECTNISAGGFNEHYKNEWVDLNYTYKVYQDALKVDWESLPVKRELEERFSKSKGIKKYLGFNSRRTVTEIDLLFSIADLVKTRDIEEDDMRKLTYSKYLKDIDVNVTMSGPKILLEGEESSMDGIKKFILGSFREDIIENLEYFEEIGNKKGSSMIRKHFSL
jgi:hypothetical protein